MADFDIDGTFHELLKDLHYLPLGDVGKIKAAFSCAKRAHTGQKRASGEPYISHPLSVAKTTASWHLDCDAICAALLHDVLEDTKISKSELLCQFGKNIADLVDGLSKLDKLEFSSYQEAQATAATIYKHWVLCVQTNKNALPKKHKKFTHPLLFVWD